MTASTSDVAQSFTCPHAMFQSYLESWMDMAGAYWHNNTQNFYEIYVCQFSAYWAFRDRCAEVEGYSVLLLGALGCLGALGIVLTLNQTSFSQLDFMLHRVIGYLEMIQMADVTAMVAMNYFQCEKFYICAFVWAHLATTVANICSDAVDLIVLFLSIERTVACLLPHYFRNLHDRRVYYCVEIFCLSFPAIFATLQAFEISVFYDEQAGRYRDESSEFSQTQFYAGVVMVNMIRFYVTAVLITVAIVASVVGFLSVERRVSKLKSGNVLEQRRRSDSSRKMSTASVTSRPNVTSLRGLLSSSVLLFTSIVDRRDSNVSQQNRRKSSASSRQRRQTELCCLQLCLAVPVVINLILYASGLTMSHYSSITGKHVFDHNITFEKAMEDLELARSFQYLRVATNISNVLAHALHFYLYLIFCNKVREGFGQLLKCLAPCRASGQRTPQTHQTPVITDNGNVHCDNTHLAELKADCAEREHEPIAPNPDERRREL